MKRALMAIGALLVVAAAIAAWRPQQIMAYFMVAPELHQGRAFVTGTRDDTRIPGFGRALVDTIRKLTGDFTITDAQVAGAMTGPVQDYVASYAETDRMARMPIHDEQGTRDRPFLLEVSFKPAMVDALAARLGKAPWTDDRGATLVLLTVDADAAHYLVTEDGDRGDDKRQSLQAAAWLAGLPIILPRKDQLGDADKISADRILKGRIAWARELNGWRADWSMETADGPNAWRIGGVNFDEAFRHGRRGCWQRL
jgi:uncharacterized protein